MPNGDGAFIALSVSCALYERYAVARLEQSIKKADKKNRLDQFMTDFAADERTAEVFWSVIRDGLAHQAMPLHHARRGKHPPWWFHESYPDTTPIRLENVRGTEVLKVQPWQFMDRVLSLWQDNTDLLTSSSSFPWGNIFDQ